MTNKPNSDFIDAEFQVIKPSYGAQSSQKSAPPLGQENMVSIMRKRQQASTQKSAMDTNKDDGQLGVFLAPPTAPATERSLSNSMFFALTAVLMVGIFVATGGHTLLFPSDNLAGINADTAAATNPLMRQTLSQSIGPLEIFDTQITPGNRSGQIFLAIAGRIRNNSQTIQQVPPLLITTTNQAGQRVQSTINRGEMLKPGEQLAFTTHIPTGDREPVSTNVQFAR